MAKVPEPPDPATLAARTGPETLVLSVGTELWRIYFRGGPYPGHWRGFRTFGPVRTARFDHHEPPPRNQTRGVLYAATSIPICVAEVFQATRTLDRQLRDPWLVGFRLRRPVPLLDVGGSWPTRAGASMGLNSGPRPRTQRWSAAMYAAYPDLEGIWYPSSMYKNEPAVMLYERAGDALEALPFLNTALSAPGLLAPLAAVAREIGYLLI